MLDFNSLPSAVEKMLQQNEEIMRMLSSIKSAAGQMQDKGAKIVGIAKIAKHFKIGNDRVNALIAEGKAPIYNSGHANYCYVNEMDEYFKINKKIAK